MSDSMNSKEALFALETTMEEDMAGYADEATGLVIKAINSDPELYKAVNLDNTITLKKSCVEWAKAHNDEFGGLFITELDAVKWGEVFKRV